MIRWEGPDRSPFRGRVCCEHCGAVLAEARPALAVPTAMGLPNLNSGAVVGALHGVIFDPEPTSWGWRCERGQRPVCQVGDVARRLAFAWWDQLRENIPADRLTVVSVTAAATDMRL